MLGPGASMMLGDLKLVDPLSSDPARVGLPGGRVGFGNTAPPLRGKMYGCIARGCAADGAFNPRTGAGFVPASSGDYTAALANGCTVLLLLFETFGGFGPALVRLLKRAAAEVENKLTPTQYDETTWSART